VNADRAPQLKTRVQRLTHLTLVFQMLAILASPVMVDVLRDSRKDCEHNPDLCYDFTNEVHWPLFLDNAERGHHRGEYAAWETAHN
jgi:hypothetical protein